MMSLLNTLFLCFSLYAGTIESHKTEIAEFNRKIALAEKKLTDLKLQKTQVHEGEELDEILTDITETHREILNVRSKRNELKQHLKAEHPDSDLIFNTSLYRKTKSEKKRGKQDPVDEKLDSMLLLVQSQYAQYMTDFNAPKEDNLKNKVKTSKEKAKANTRKEYIKKRIKTEMKVE